MIELLLAALLAATLMSSRFFRQALLAALLLFGLIYLWSSNAKAGGSIEIQAAQAAPPRGKLVTHNGSLMEVILGPGGRMSIVYVEPRPGLLEIGIVPGTLLIAGRWRGPIFSADARVFDPQCGAVLYRVEGSADPAGVLILEGPAPVVWAGSCVIAEYIWTHNSRLVFVPVR
jgi:hypothetical protein